MNLGFVINGTGWVDLVLWFKVVNLSAFCAVFLLYGFLSIT